MLCCCKLAFFEGDVSQLHKVDTFILHDFFVLAYLQLADKIFAFFRMYVWELLHLTIRKMNKYVQKLQKEVNDARNKLSKVIPCNSFAFI